VAATAPCSWTRDRGRIGQVRPVNSYSPRWCTTRVKDHQIRVAIPIPVHDMGPGISAAADVFGVCDAYLDAFGEGAVRTPQE
jgi:hypothetical protein